MAKATLTNHPATLALSGGDFPRRFMTIMVAAGQALSAGSVLGEVSASEEYKLSESGAFDGSESPSLVLFEDIDTSEGAAPAEAMLTGDVPANALTLGTGHTAASVRKALRPYCLFVH